VNSNNLIEILTLVSGIIVSVTGALTTIRNRRANDTALGGTDLERAKATQDIVRVDQSYIEQAEAMRKELIRVQAELVAARARSSQQQPPPTSPAP